MDFNKIFGNNMIYNTIKRHKEVERHPVSRKYFLGKTIRVVK